jgi:kinesin family member 1
MLMTDASQNTWEKRWFVLRRPFLHMYSHSNEQDEVGIVSLTGVNVESDRQKEELLGVSINNFKALIYSQSSAEAVFILPFHILELSCPSCS